MVRNSNNLWRWALAGAIVAVLLSMASLLLPTSLGGYNPWNDLHLLFHNIAAIVIRIVLFAFAGAALAGMWHHKRRRGE